MVEPGENELLEACLNLDLPKVKQLVSDGADTGYQDPNTGYGPLHQIILGTQTTPEPTQAMELLEYLLLNGAVWMQVDRTGESPGCLTRRLGQDSLYQIIVSAGIRSEYLLNYLDRKHTDSIISDSENNIHSKFLESELTYDDNTGVLYDDHGAPVMMRWEDRIMERSSEILLPNKGEGRVLNIGFGLGIIDEYLQNRKPTSHVIVEAHPLVIKRMKEQGWDKKANVEIIYGKWQDVVETLSDGEPFDAIYYDPYAEFYTQLRDFFEAVVGLLNPQGTFSFFNGLGADRQTFYDVYSGIVEIDLATFGIHVVYEDIPINLEEREWEGVKNGRYWNLDSYKLPICKFLQ